MTKPENTFLTENRRDVLKGTSEWTDRAINNEKSRIRKRATLAMDELIEVAASPEIDNESIDGFHQDTVARLIHALMMPENRTLTPRWNFDGDSRDYQEVYSYQIGLQGRLDLALDGYQDMLRREVPPGETRTFGDVLDLDK